MGTTVFISDSRPASEIAPQSLRVIRRFSHELGQHSEKILAQDLIVVSPGIHLDLPILKKARKKNIEILGEIELGWQLGGFKNVLAVTGTNGKTTTVSLLGHMCKKAGLKTLVAGNIGSPLCDYIGQADRFERTVLEISSYQLESSVAFRPDVACVLNLTADHLERHHTLRGYSLAKQRIFMNQTTLDYAVLNLDDAWCKKMSTGNANRIFFSTNKSLKAGVFYDRKFKKIRFSVDGKKGVLPLPAHLPGLHNIENACAAAAMALASKVPPAAIAKSLLTFKGVEHRIETVLTLRGVGFINDSKATNVDSTAKALQALHQPLWLILGGQDKGSPYAPLKPLIKKKVKGILMIGEAAKIIEKGLGKAAPMFHCGTLDRAVSEAFKRAESGDAILLSPACASFDQFKNFEDRGNRFKAFVRRLKS